RDWSSDVCSSDLGAQLASSAKRPSCQRSSRYPASSSPVVRPSAEHTSAPSLGSISSQRLSFGSRKIHAEDRGVAETTDRQLAPRAAACSTVPRTSRRYASVRVQGSTLLT